MHSNGSDFWWCIQATKEERDGKTHNKSQAAGTAAAGMLHKPANNKGDLNKERGATGLVFAGKNVHVIDRIGEC